MLAGDQHDSLASLRRKKPLPRRPTQPDLFPSEPESPQIPERRIWSVRGLVSDIRLRTESQYNDVWVEGEISNCHPAASGHIYFTLKDGEAQLPIVLFRRQATLLRFRPEDGLAVLVRGRISVYESRGQLQLIAESMEPRGAGALQVAFEQLKRRLAEEGLFEAARKRPLPLFPHCIGIVTSPTGAVIRDIVSVVRRRHGRLNILVYPALMQGGSCCSSVAAGIRYFNAHPELVDLIILARGGGSIEDLAGFNEEALARAIAASALPVVSAIGHETDFTIADFVADLRATTPSAAAEMVTAAQHRIEDQITLLTARSTRAIRFQLIDSRQRYGALSADSVLSRLRDSLYRREQRLDDLRYRLESSVQRRLHPPSTRLGGLAQRLARQAPSARLGAARRRLERAREALTRAGATLISTRLTGLARATTRLEGLSPVAVLDRGYALVYSADGALLRSSDAASPGQQIHARLAHGFLVATVVSLHAETQRQQAQTQQQQAQTQQQQAETQER